MVLRFTPPRDPSVVPGVQFTKPAHEGASCCIDGRKFWQCTCGWTVEWWNYEPQCGLAAAQARFLTDIEASAATVLAEQVRGQYAALELSRARAGERR